MLCLLTIGMHLVAANDMTLQMVVSANRQTRESLHSVHATGAFTYSTAQPAIEGIPQRQLSGEYWRKGDWVRTRDDFPDQKKESLVRDGRIEAITHELRDGRTLRSAGVIRNDEHDTFFDLWEWSLLSHGRDAVGRNTVDAIFSQPGARLIARETPVRGHPCVVLETRVRSATVRGYFDPRLNYLARKLEIEVPSSIRVVREVTRFRGIAPGLSFPDEMSMTTITNDQPGAREITKTLTLRTLSVNQKLADDVFQLTIPPGTLVANYLRGTTYIADGMWSPFGQERPLPRPPDEVPVRTSASSQTALDADEDTAPRSWVMALLITTVAGASAMMILRRRST